MTGPSVAATFVYVANADSRDISVLRLDLTTGVLEPVERVPVEGTVMPLTVSPDRRFLYASIRSEPLEVLSFAIEPASGRLAHIGRAPLPASMCWIGTDASGRFLLGASYGASLVAVGPIDANGVAQAAQQSVATPANAHAVRTDPRNRFLFAACLGGGVVLGFPFDAATGRIGVEAPVSWTARPGAGPRHFAFHPAMPVAYLLNELDGWIDVLAFDTERGIFAKMQTIDANAPGLEGAPWAADIHVSPDGRFVYSCERRGSTLAAFAVDARSGRLRLVGHVPTETQPRSFAIDASGRWLVAVGQLSDRARVYAIDDSSGALRPCAEAPVGANANWVEIVSLP